MDSYSNRNDLKYHLDFTDFVIRDSVPTKIDIFISIWIIGIQKNSFFKFLLKLLILNSKRSNLA